MTVVVSDTSPLSYLIEINCEHLLPALYGRVLIPRGVFEELSNPRTPASVRAWLSHSPSWLMIKEASPITDPNLEEVDPGERQAIQLAMDEHADALIIDDRAGARLAVRFGLEVTGTLGVLLEGAKRDLVDLEAALRNLQLTAFRYTPKLIEEIRRRSRT
jgi:predicted nucleic acid-binding protein